MSDLRKDPISGSWVIIAPERARRPLDFVHDPPTRERREACPFCPGHEDATPPEIAAIREGGAWRLRVVPNRYPALRTEEQLRPHVEGLLEARTGVGAHEVIIESPEHVRSLGALDAAQVARVFGMCRARLLDLKRDTRLVYGLIFKNVGPRAGASLEHTHSQLIATPVVPERVQAEIDRAARHRRERGSCLQCDLLLQERMAGARVVLETANFVALEPFASRTPFETHVVPRAHQSHFEGIDEAVLPELAEAVRTALRKIEKALDEPAYNLILQSAPLGSPPSDFYHWRMEILPRVAGVAGFELGTGFFINTVPPEEAAEYLRNLRG
jgi:UDPglucose--hexose-1-phosphate uridylyltransferase